jgi:hypothetical protein
MSERAQAYTLEGVVAAIIIVTSVMFALQAVTITPTTPGSIDPDTRGQLRTQATDVLATAHENESLRRAALFWNVSASTFHDDSPGNVSEAFGYGLNPPPGEFGGLLEQSFAQRGFTYNVYLEYRNGSDRSESEAIPLVRRGVPTDNAVSSTHVVTLYDDMTLTAPGDDGELRLAELDAGDYFAEDAYPNSPVYNLVRVRVVVW